ncbi:hypothetical protein ASD11_14205 [Aeromicrobium sp. Root495]|uniref:hypothetical protein n=1 Tax=Aeromicrobium sp. Root495 TaxID=1736550 RepID=UPI0006FC52BF|nr:hypothetical protein [Aeromicrobium sp. Root495]KQY55664.1 hypothetical protein ASD11_14205 [Aeromicrobium sp. Root495]
MTLTQTASIAALLASTIQVYWRLRTHQLDEKLVHHFAAARGLMEEVRWTHPVRRIRRRREVTRELLTSPRELHDYRRVYWDLVSWVCLAIGAIYGVAAAFT